MLYANYYENKHNVQPELIAMLKRRFGILFLIGCLILVSVPTALCMSPPPVVYVSGDGSGDFNCDGKDDHVQINQALKFVSDNSRYTTVYLKGPFRYVIDDTIRVGSNTILEGDSDAVITIKNNNVWDKNKPMIAQINPKESTKGTIVIRGFEIDGNYAGNAQKPRGKSYHNLMWLYYDDVEVSNMYLHDSHGDGLKIMYSKNVKFHNNRIYKLGHDGLYAIKCQNVEAWNNNVRCKTNSALRIYNSNHIKLHDNVIYTEFESDAGGPGIQIQYIRESTPHIMDDIEVYNNTFYDTYGPGIWLIALGQAYAKDEAKNAHIHHNTFYGCGTQTTYDWLGGIVTSGFYDTLIENNVFDGNYNAAVVYMYPTPPRFSGLEPNGRSNDYTTIVRNNIIVNTLERKYSPKGTGQGIVNCYPKTHTFILQNNCIYNNKGGDYKNASSKSDIHVNPLFADQKKHDYHLKSSAGRWNGKKWVNDNVSSPCIDAGYAYSEYSNEPEDNGNRVNIGRYGNTKYASLSGTAPVITPENPVLSEPSLFRASDNRLREASPSTVYQNSSFIDIGGMDNARYRDIMWFDLGEYTDSTKINNAALYLYWYYPAGSSRLQDTIIEVYRPASAWNVNYVSWNKRNSSIAWKNPGGDWYDKNGVLQGNTPYATITIKGSTLPDNRYYELDVTELVKEYTSGKYENTGFFIKASTESNNYIAFYSCNCGVESKEPKLKVRKKATSVSVSVASTNVTVTGAKENRLPEASPSTVDQNSSFIDIGGMDSGRHRDIMWFNLSEYTNYTEINNASLSLYWYYPAGISRPQDTVIEVYRPASDWNSSYASWNKKNNDITWTNAGGDWYDKNGVPQGNTPYATITIKGSTLPDNRYYELNVTELVKEYTSGKYENTGFFIKTSVESNNYIAFYSSNCEIESHKPRLDILYTA